MPELAQHLALLAFWGVFAGCCAYLDRAWARWD